MTLNLEILILEPKNPNQKISKEGIQAHTDILLQLNPLPTCQPLIENTEVGEHPIPRNSPILEALISTDNIDLEDLIASTIP